MKIISLTCTNCGADLTIEEGRKDCYCSYCGHHMLIDDGVKEILHRKIDEAQILEAQIRMKELEQNGIEQFYLKKYRFRKIVILATVVPCLIYKFIEVTTTGSDVVTSMIVIGIYLWILRYYNIL